MASFDAYSLNVSSAGGTVIQPTDSINLAGVTAPAATFNITSSGTTILHIDGAQLDSDDLSDVASIAMLDEDETVTASWIIGDNGTSIAGIKLKLVSDSNDSGMHQFEVIGINGTDINFYIDEAGNSYVAGTLHVVGDLTVDGGEIIATSVTFTEDTQFGDNSGDSVVFFDGMSVVPQSSGGVDLGTLTYEFGNIFIADDKYIKLGSKQDSTIGFEVAGSGTLKILTKGSAITSGLTVGTGDASAGDSGDCTYYVGTATGVRGKHKFTGDFEVQKTGNNSYKMYMGDATSDNSYFYFNSDGAMRRAMGVGVNGSEWLFNTESGTDSLIPPSGSPILGTGSQDFAALYMQSSATIQFGGSTDYQLTVSSGGFRWTVPDNQALAWIVGTSGETQFSIATTTGSELITYGDATIRPNHKINIKDNSSSAFHIVEGARNYFKVITTNGSESLSFSNATTNPSSTFYGTGDIILSNGTLDIPSGTNFKIGGSAITTAAFTAANVDDLLDGSNADALHVHAGGDPIYIDGQDCSTNSCTVKHIVSLDVTTGTDKLYINGDADALATSTICGICKTVGVGVSDGEIYTNGQVTVSMEAGLAMAVGKAVYLSTSSTGLGTIGGGTNAPTTGDRLVFIGFVADDSAYAGSTEVEVNLNISAPSLV